MIFCIIQLIKIKNLTSIKSEQNKNINHKKSLALSHNVNVIHDNNII